MSSDLIVVVEHESFLFGGSEAETCVEVVPETGDVGQGQIQVALTGEMSLTSHLHEHTHYRSRHTVLLRIYACLFYTISIFKKAELREK